MRLGRICAKASQFDVSRKMYSAPHEEHTGRSKIDMFEIENTWKFIQKHALLNH
jgi:hypothetical protein